MVSLDQQEFEKELHQAFNDYLGAERCDLVSPAICCKADNLHQQDVEGFLSKYCNIEQAVALSFILLDVHSTHVIKRLNNMFQGEHKQVKELKHMLDTDRKRNSDLQQSLELQRSQLHSKVSEIGILEMAHKYHVAEVKSLKEKVSSLRKECETNQKVYWTQR